MASGMFNIDAAGIRSLARKGQSLREGAKVCSKPLAEERGAMVVKVLRFGKRGISEQFADQTEYRVNTSTPWAKSHAFGNKKAPRKTLQGSGAYRSAWLGSGAGDYVKITPSVVTVGVDRSVFPQVAIHQGSASSVKVFPKTHISAGTITVKRRTKKGREYTQTRTKDAKDWKMRFYLGLTYGVWLTKARLEKGLEIKRRRVSVSQDVRNTVAQLIKNEVRSRVKGFKTQTMAMP